MDQQLTLKPVQATTGLSIRAPSGSDLSPWVYKYIPAQKTPANLLIMFHGLGDTEASFASLAGNMKWDHCACLSIRAPLGVPLLPDHWMWYNTFGPMFEQLPNPDPSTALPGLRKLLGQLMGLGWPLNRIHLFGWQQGATVALELALSVKFVPIDGAKRLGSVVSICGAVVREPTVTACETPVCWFTRSDERAEVAKKAEEVLRSAFSEVDIVRGKPGSLNMPGQEEWKGVFTFWGRVMAKPDEGWKGDGEIYEVVQ